MAVQCQARRTKRIAKPHKCTTPQADLPMHKIHLTTVGVHSNDADHHRFRKLKSRNHRHLCISRLCRPTDRTARDGRNWNRNRMKPDVPRALAEVCIAWAVQSAHRAARAHWRRPEAHSSLPALRWIHDSEAPKTSTKKKISKLPRSFLFPYRSFAVHLPSTPDVLSRLRCSPNTSPIQMP